MSLNLQVSVSPTGARKISPIMLEARERADRFRGLPAGTAKPFAYLAAFQEAEPYLGLPAQAFKLVAWLVKQTMPCDWEAGSRPIAWPSARHQQEFLGLSLGRVKALNRALFEAGIFVIRDNEQGKRYGRRGPDKRIIEAYGFDLSPLALRCDEFIRIAAEAKVERRRMQGLRKRVTIGRRAIRQAGEVLAELAAPLPPGWGQLAAETAELVAEAKAAERSAELALIAQAIEARQAQAERWLKEAIRPVDQPVSLGSNSVETDPEGSVCDPHTTDTNLSSNLTDTVIAAEGSSQVGTAARVIPKPPGPSSRRSVAGMREPVQLIELFPRLGQYIWARDPGMPEIVEAAGGALREELGISPSLWAEACRVMGCDVAAVALAIVSTKADGHFTRGPGGYFGGMVRKAEKGELYLEKTLWGLRQAKFGKMGSQQESARSVR